MMSFWIFAALLVVIALVYLLPPLLQREDERPADESERANVSVYRDQFDELERDLRDGVLDGEQYEQGRAGKNLREDALGIVGLLLGRPLFEKGQRASRQAVTMPARRVVSCVLKSEVAAL